jgi:signal transduction histidine kinase
VTFMTSLRADGWGRLTALWRRIGPRTRDIAFIGIALMATAAEALAGRHGGRAAWLGALLIGLIGTASLWWRRRYPVAVTAVGLVGLAVTAVPVTACVGLFTLAIRRRDLVLALMTVLTAAVFAAAATRTTSGSIVGNIISGALVGGFSCAAGAYVGARRDLVASLRERAERAEGEREQRANQARAEERTRIAREMHDVLAHKVSLIALHAGALEVSRGADERVQRTAALIGATAHEAMEDLREVLGVLRTGADHDGTELAPQPSIADIERVVGDSLAAGVRTDLTIELNAADVPESVGRAAYRVVREGLTNAHKHARGAATSVMVTGDAEKGVRVEVVNCASVFATTLLPGSGAGLPGLRERVTLLGGTLDAGPTDAGGWRLVVWLPWT